MSEFLASFRELRGIGPASEARLHDAGLYTWTALSDVLAVLTRIGGRTDDAVVDLADQVAAHIRGAADDVAPRQPAGERTEAFIVRLALAPDGGALRSSVTSVRTQTERPWAGWSPAELLAFVEQQSGLRAATPAPTPDPTPAPTSIPAVESTPESIKTGNGAGRRTRDHVILLDAGKAIGGKPRDVTLDVSTAPLSGLEAFEFQATLAARRLAPGTAPGKGWVTLATRSGVGTPPEALPLRFEGVAMSPGIQRLRLELALRLPVGAPAPALVLAG